MAGRKKRYLKDTTELPPARKHPRSLQCADVFGREIVVGRAPFGKLDFPAAFFVGRQGVLDSAVLV